MGPGVPGQQRARHHEQPGQRQGERQGVEQHQLPGGSGETAAHRDPRPEEQGHREAEDGHGALQEGGVVRHAVEG
ncbi:hypothetical protein RCG67_03925 [Kocuria sp. CPCC 205292]|uniref:hypothetical protein n=1 Tax=Kocuria cellulosilytica TaxID=3071451 RepID=UPI0034D521DE